MKAVAWPDPKIVEDNDIVIFRVPHGDDGPIKVLFTP